MTSMPQGLGKGTSFHEDPNDQKYQDQPGHLLRTEPWGSARDGLGSGEILDFRFAKRKERNTYHSHSWIHLDAIVVEVWILVPLQHLNTMLNALNTSLGAGNGKLDHSSSLVNMLATCM